MFFTRVYPAHNPPSDTWFASISSKSAAYLFIFYRCLSKAEVNSDETEVITFSFMSSVFGVTAKKTLSNPRSPRCSPTFSSRSFRILGFTFRSKVYFELIFVHSSRHKLGGFCTCISNNCSTVSWPFLNWIAFALSSNIGWPYMCGSFSGLHVLFHYFICLCFHQTTLCWWLQLHKKSLKSSVTPPPLFCFEIVWLSSFLYFSI